MSVKQDFRSDPSRHGDFAAASWTSVIRTATDDYGRLRTSTDDWHMAVCGLCALEISRRMALTHLVPAVSALRKSSTDFSKASLQKYFILSKIFIYLVFQKIKTGKIAEGKGN